MHDYESVDDQLAAGARQNAACLECHSRVAADPERHTRHAAGSSGSLCMNCHMPHTTYGLFSAIRSHRIDHPSVANSVETGRLNACNLCHLDKTLAWADRELQRGWNVAPTSIPDEGKAIAASVQWALSGDAAQRAIVGWHFGWAPALEASGRDWPALFLAQLLSDPYAAVRKVAGRALEGRRGFSGFDYDFLAQPARLHEKSREALDRWAEETTAQTFEGRERLLLRPNRQVDRTSYSRLLEARDHTPLRIIE